MSVMKSLVTLIAIVVVVACSGMGNTAEDITHDKPSQQSKISSGVWEKTRANGTVRVIVDLNVPEWVSKNLSKEDELAQRRTIADAQNLVLQELAGTRYKINRQFETVPGLAMEVGPDALAVLERSPRVLHVSEDAKLSPSLKKMEIIKPSEKKTSK